jgi:hypothetical protein
MHVVQGFRGRLHSCTIGSRSNASFLVDRTRDSGADRGVVFTAHIIRA